MKVLTARFHLSPRREGCRVRASAPHCAPFGRLCGVTGKVSLWDTVCVENQHIRDCVRVSHPVGVRGNYRWYAGTG